MILAPIVDSIEGFVPGALLRAGDVALPLESVNVDAVVDGCGVVWTVAQTFVNTLDEAMEATYTFPLPASGAVNRATMHIGERVVEAEMKERGAARVEYQEALAKGQTAMLVEQHAAEIFETAVGNIHPGERIRIELVVHATVVRDGNVATVRFPTLIKPRYIPEGTPNGDALTPPRHLGEVHVNSTVRVTFTAPVDELVCATVPHATVTPSHVAIADFALDRDIVLHWHAEADVFDAKWTADPNDADSGTVEVILRTAEPPKTESATKRAVSILIDRSGSMEGWNMQAAIRIASDAVGSLTRDDLIHVAAFDNTIDVLGPTQRGFATATAETRQTLRREISALDARGGTELDAAIAAAGGVLVQLDKRTDACDFERVVLLITDGAYGDEATAARQREMHLRGARVIIVGIGQELNGYLEILAANGWFTGVEAEHAVGDVAKKVCARLREPAHRNARIAMPGLTDQAPQLAPDVYAGATVTLWGRAPRPTAGQTLTVVTDSGTLAIVPVRISHDASATTRWAKARINALDYDVMTDRVDEASGRAAIIALSIGHRVLSKYTAWLAVDRSRTTDTIVPQRVVQPSPVHEAALDHMTCYSMPIRYSMPILGSRSWTVDVMDLVPLLEALDTLLGEPALDTAAVTSAVAAIRTWLDACDITVVGRRLLGKLLRRLEKLEATPFPSQRVARRLVTEMREACIGRYPT